MTWKMGQVMYKVYMPAHHKKHQVFHINRQKKWSESLEPEP